MPCQMRRAGAAELMLSGLLTTLTYISPIVHPDAPVTSGYCLVLALPFPTSGEKISADRAAEVRNLTVSNPIMTGGIQDPKYALL